VNDARLRRPLLPLLLVLLGLPACGADVSDASLDRADPAQCSGAWQVIFTPRQERAAFPPNTLRWHRDRLYFVVSNLAEGGLHSLPTAGGPTSMVSRATPWRFWVEEDGVTFAAAEGLQTIPLLGGPAERLIPLPAWTQRGAPLAQALDDQGLYWISSLPSSDTSTAWALHQQPRTGEPQRELARVTSAGYDTVEAIVPVGEQLALVPYSGKQIRVVPRAGGEARLLPDGGDEEIGLSPEGAILWRKDEGGFDGSRGSDRYSVRQSHVDGRPPAPFWAEKPPNAYPRAAWGDGTGGWYVSTWEWGSDEALHTVLWSLDRTGRGRRLACDPEVQSSVETAVVGSDALYAIVRYSNFNHWAIVRIAAPAR
jgi:hypothetical protein